MPAFSLVRILTMLALLLMPLAMAGQAHAGGAMAHHAESGSAEAHRHEGSSHRQEERQQDGIAQCMMACAALPAADAAPDSKSEAPRASLYALPIVPISGLAPEAETPPPRFA